jgi:NAD(P)-dependent dehydrogenase (short-subunit alcohol dehydrogenase family)
MSTGPSPPQGRKPPTPTHPPPEPRDREGEKTQKKDAAAFLGPAKRLPEFNLGGRVVLISGAARGLGLTQAEALLEAGATVYALDILPEPSPEFLRIQERAVEELGTRLHYCRVDVRDNEVLNKTVKDIADAEGRMDGLIAAAGIQKEVPALEYTQEDANHMFSVNISGVFMTAQAVARQMVRFKKGGSIVLIGSMSAHVANKVQASSSPRYLPTWRTVN